MIALSVFLLAIATISSAALSVPSAIPIIQPPPDTLPSTPQSINATFQNLTLSTAQLDSAHKPWPATPFTYIAGEGIYITVSTLGPDLDLSLSDRQAVFNALNTIYYLTASYGPMSDDVRLPFRRYKGAVMVLFARGLQGTLPRWQVLKAMYAVYEMFLEYKPREIGFAKVLVAGVPVASVEVGFEGLEGGGEA